MSEYPLFFGLEARVVVAEQVDHPGTVQAVAGIGNAGLLGERQSQPAVLATQFASVAGRTRRNGGDGLTVGAPEAERPAGAPFDRVAALVEEAVMVGADVDEVRQVRSPAPRPVVDVVGVQESPLGAAGEAAGAVATLQGAAERRRHASALAPHGQGSAVALKDPHHVRVAGQAARSLGVQRRPLLELARAVLVVDQRGGLDVTTT
jgi:hypothetical protein